MYLIANVSRGVGIFCMSVAGKVVYVIRCEKIKKRRQKRQEGIIITVISVFGL